MNNALGRGPVAAVLAALRDRRTATVSDLAIATGLSRPTVDSAVAQLEEAQLVTTEAAATTPRRGRPAKTATFVPGDKLVVGVDLTGSHARILVCDIAGGVRAVSPHGTPTPVGGAAQLSPIVELLHETLAFAGSHISNVCAVGVGIAGLIEPDGTLATAPQVPSWAGCNMVNLFEDAFGVPVTVENDLTLAAAAEAQSPSLHGCDVGVYALAWFHASARIVINGHVLRGRTGLAGEVGLLAGPSDVKGPNCVLREGVPAVIADLERLRTKPDDVDGLQTLDDLAESMAPSIAALALAVDPNRIVLGGDLADFSDLIAPRLQQAIVRRVPTHPTHVDIVPHALGQHAVALGAIQNTFTAFSELIYGSQDVTPPALPTIEAVDSVAAQRATREPFRAVIVGVGARAGLAQNVEAANGKIVAAVDPDGSTRAKVDRIFGENVPLFASIDELLASGEKVHGAIVASPDDTHADIAEVLLRAKIPVYLEKPLAITTEDCDRVLQIAHETGTKLYVGHNMRHMHVVRLMKEIIDRGEIGEVKAIWCRHFVGTGGDFYFKDWHADRSRSTSLLVQKGAHDIDVMQWLAGSSARVVTGMGDLAVYGQIDDRRDNSDRRMWDWFSTDNWPPMAQTQLNPIIDVEDISMIMARLDSGALISYQQCHFTPDYWRNYTVIGTEGRLENFGDGEGGEVRVWNARTGYLAEGHRQYPIVGDANGHEDADVLTVREFIEAVRSSAPAQTSPISARDAVATGVAGAESIRSGSQPVYIPPVDDELRRYFDANQVRTNPESKE